MLSLFCYNIGLREKFMKIRLLSDLHTEFRLPFKTASFAEYHDEDVLVLAGDIASGSTNTISVIKFFLDQGFPDVVYVPGNHEYYGGDFIQFNEKMTEKMAEYLKRVPEFPKQAQLKLPQLKKIELPKLNKV